MPLRFTVGDQVDEIDIDKLLNVEIMAIERAAGMTFPELTEGLERGSMISLTALLWVARKRQQPDLKFDQVVFPATGFTVEDLEDASAEGKAEASEPATAST